MNDQQDHPKSRAGMNRRTFVKIAGTGAVASGLAGWIPQTANAAPTVQSKAETFVKRFYQSLSPTQRNVVCLPFDDARRSRISPNWHVTEPLIGDDFFKDNQRELITEILKSITSEDGYERFLKQMDDDDGGVEAYSIAMFGNPEVGKFEWELTGRHLTIRADGNSVDKMAFGGPIVYGHGEEEPKNNLFHYQTKVANEVFAALDPKQRKAALLAKAPRETDVPLQGPDGQFPGVSVSELSKDQQELVEKTIQAMLKPYREEDINEVLEVLKQGGGFSKLAIAYYQQDDLKSDKIWDIWRVEGPNFVWHFRGAPHVHTYLNVGIVSDS